MNSTILVALVGVLGLVGADWLLGVLGALRNGTFSVSALPRQLESTVLPVVGSLTVLAFLQSTVSTQYSGWLAGGFTAAVAAYAPKAVLDIVNKVEALLPGSTTPAPAPPAA